MHGLVDVDPLDRRTRLAAELERRREDQVGDLGTVAELRERDLEVTGVRTDVSDLASMRALADAAVDAYGRVDIVFPNAGVSGGGELLGDDIAVWERVVGVNFEVAALVLDAIDDGRFWAVLTPDTDKRIFGGKLTGVTAWQADMIRAKADSMADGTAPDIWG